MNERRRTDEKRAEVSVVSEYMWTIGLRSDVIKHNINEDETESSAVRNNTGRRQQHVDSGL